MGNQQGSEQRQGHTLHREAVNEGETKNDTNKSQNHQHQAQDNSTRSSNNNDKLSQKTQTSNTTTTSSSSSSAKSTKEDITLDFTFEIKSCTEHSPEARRVAYTYTTYLTMVDTMRL